MIQPARQRYHREAYRRLLEQARCSVCHEPIVEESYVVDRVRRLRICNGCWREPEFA